MWRDECVVCSPGADECADCELGTLGRSDDDDFGSQLWDSGCDRDGLAREPWSVLDVCVDIGDGTAVPLLGLDGSGAVHGYECERLGRHEI